MANKALVAIVGASGSGKSTSLRNLDHTKTVILDGERKGFPFKGSEKFTVLPFSNPKQFEEQLKKALDTPNIEVVVIESYTKFVEQAKTLCQLSYKGFDIWSNYARMAKRVLLDCKNEKAVIVWVAIDEIVDLPNPDGSTVAKRMISVEGKEMKGKVEAEFLIVLFTEPKKNKDGKMEYFFATNTDGITTAKSPMLMFPEQLIPNDLNAVLVRAKEYYSTP